MDKLCKIRDIYRSLIEFENRFEKEYGLCLNEGMVLCCLSKVEQLTSGEISGQLGLLPSNTSKIIRILEKKGLIERGLGETDRRQMFFSLTDTGKKCFDSIDCIKVEVPDWLEPLIKSEV